MSTFENGWICKSCWTANREQDVHCYRCKALSPEYHVVTEPPGERVPRGPRRSVVAPVVVGARGAVVRMVMTFVVFVGAAMRWSLRSLRGGAFAVAAVSRRVTIGILREMRSLVTATYRLAHKVLVWTFRTLLRGARLASSAAIAVAMTLARASTASVASVGRAARWSALAIGRLAAGLRASVSRSANRLARGAQALGSNLRHPAGTR